MKNIAVICAMDVELEYFTSALEDIQKINLPTLPKILHGRHHNCNIYATVSGMGKVNAALKCAEIIRNFHPDIVINIGISGGLDPCVNIGDFVIGKNIVYHDVWCGEPNAYGQVQNLPAIYHSNPQILEKIPDLRQGLICCGDQFIADHDQLHQIKQHFPQALAVDMESAAIAQTCYIYNVPLFVIRQISDTPYSENSQQQYDNFWKNAPQKSAQILLKILEIL